MPEHAGRFEIQPEQQLKSLGIDLPEPTRPVASYLPAVQTGSLVMISGQIPISDGSLMAKGLVPSEVAVEEASGCARQCAINALAALKSEIGSLDRVRRVVRLGCFVACDAGFTQHPQVANGASELMFEVFGEIGRHARAAVGCSSLPLGVPVEIEFLFEVES